MLAGFLSSSKKLSLSTECSSSDSLVLPCLAKSGRILITETRPLEDVTQSRNELKVTTPLTGERALQTRENPWISANHSTRRRPARSLTGHAIGSPVSTLAHSSSSNNSSTQLFTATASRPTEPSIARKPVLNAQPAMVDRAHCGSWRVWLRAGN
jgi:hypothetical protein